jgi:hypothetical protein
METKKLSQKIKIIYCDICDYTCFDKQRYTRHCMTKKHIGNIGNKKTIEKTISTDINNNITKYHNDTKQTNNINIDDNENGNDWKQKTKPNIKNNYSCYCGKVYANRSGIWKHKQICNVTHYNNKEEETLVHNNDFMKFVTQHYGDLNTIIKDLVKNGINTNNSHNTNTNSNNTNNINNTFNLQVYLNETCKNAMNLSEFIENIKPTIEELELTGREGYAKGISYIVNTRLNNVNTEEKPIQCADGKREVLYIKENNIWNKEYEEKPLLISAIKRVTHKNMCNILEWQKMHPGCTNSDSRKNDIYLNIVSNSMPGLSKEESDKNYEKIISSLAKNTIIEK